MVERGLTEIRLALLGILVTIGLSVGFGVPCRWWVRLLAAVASTFAAGALIYFETPRKCLMRFASWLIGEKRRA